MPQLSDTLVLTSCSLLIGCAPTEMPATENPTSAPPEQRRSSMVQRPVPPRDGDGGRRPDRRPGDALARFPEEVRTIDGVGNNLTNPDWGAAGAYYLRTTSVDYADGAGAPSGGERSGARLISNAVVAQSESIPNSADASDFVWQWGQFLDHDIDETPVADPAEAFDVPVPIGDPWFDPNGTGVVTIGLDRSSYAVIDGTREQVNQITAYIDASNVYGSEIERTEALRTLDGSGRLRTSAGDLLPFNDVGLANAPSADPSLFLAGDIRANEQVGLTAMHTLFVREHNHWADRIADAVPDLDGDQIFEAARAIVAAEMQAITYNEFLPALLGAGALRPYDGYDATVDAGIANVFAAAAYRFGHSMLSPRLLRLDARGNEIEAGHLSLASAFFNPDETIEHGIEPVLRGLAAQAAQEIDVHLIDEVRNFLFGPPGSGGFDLASLNIQRGRDHGIPGYNQVRVDYGLPRVASFAEITSDLETQAALASVYATVDEIDAWVGGLAEPHAPGALVGETWLAVLSDQFERLRDGDRFWYQSYLPRELVRLVERQTLSRIIRRNTTIGRELPASVFALEGSESAALEPNVRNSRHCSLDSVSRR